MRVSEPGAVEECGACAELLVPRSVTSVLSEGCTLSVSAAALQVTRICPEVLLVFGVGLVLSVGLVCSPSVLSGEGTSGGVVQLLPCLVLLWGPGQRLSPECWRYGGAGSERGTWGPGPPGAHSWPLVPFLQELIGWSGPTGDIEGTGLASALLTGLLFFSCLLASREESLVFPALDGGRVPGEMGTSRRNPSAEG